MTEKPLDLTKPVRTRDGREVRILCTDGPPEQPICGIIEGKDGGDYWSWPLSGKSDAFPETRNLVNIEPDPVTMWGNVYRRSCYFELGQQVLYSTEAEARRCIQKDIIGDYVATVPVTFTPNE